MENNQQKDPRKNDNFFNKNPLLVFAIFSILTVLIFRSLFEDGSFDGTGSGGASQTQNVSYYELKKLVEAGQVSFVSIGESSIKATGKSEAKTVYVAKRVIPDDTLIPMLEKQNVKYGAYTEKNWLTDLVFGWVLPVFIFFAIWMFLTSRMQKNMGGGILGIGSMKKLMNSEKPKVKFADVAGNDEAKEEVQELIEFLKSPDRYIKLGAKIPKGVLLVGPPGTGKTLLAKAVAGEAEVPFFSVSGSSFIEMFVGVGASRVRDLFEQAKKEAPSIIFIDELDAIGKSRAMGHIGGNDEREQTLNQMLAEMDGFGAESPVIVLAATNRPEILDPALLRPGRFDRQVLVDKPDFKGRVEILKVHAKNVKLSDDTDLEELAKLTAGLAGADLANIINEAALLAGRESQESVSQQNLKEAVERAIAGLEKKSRRISPKEKKIVAYHESGHAIISQITKGSKKVNKVSIIPRGLAALGYTLNTPEENKYLVQKHELIAEVDVLLGGRAAEELFIGEISTGAANDLERATDIIKSMIMYYGMSEVAGLMVLEKQRNTFLGGGMGQTKDYSEKMSEELDSYIKAKLTERYAAVKEKLETYREAMESMTAELLEIEVLEKDRVEEIISGFEKEKGIVRESDEDELHAQEQAKSSKE
ncbi:MAG: ATP-dependent zinc metalloprotease FtsH [Campylobacterales bacterium]